MNTTVAACAFLTFTSQLGYVPQYDEYCNRNPSACQQIEVTTERIELNKQNMEKIGAVNNLVNHSVKKREDIDVYKTEEYWTIAGKKGDCEDIALLKQRMLELEGFAKSNLILSIVYDEENKGHTILTVRTDKGDYVLDIKSDNIVLWHKRPYKYLMSQSPDDRNTWYVTEEQCKP